MENKVGLTDQEMVLGKPEIVGERENAIGRGILKATEVFKSAGHDFRLSGGFAVDVITGNEEVDYNEILDGTRDVDFIIMANLNKEEKDRLKEQASTDSGLRICISHSRVLKFRDESPALRYGDIDIEVPRKVFEPVSVKVGDSTVNTVAPSTLFHLYSTAGFLRKKDYPRLRSLARFMKENPEKAGFSEENYVGFHSFLKQRMRYKSYQALVGVQKIMGPENYNKLMELPGVQRSLRGVYQLCHWTEGKITKSLSEVVSLPEAIPSEENE